MTQKKNDDLDTRGAVVVQPRVPPRGSFSLLLPPNMVWEEHPVAGGIRLDFRIATARDIMKQIRERSGR